MSGRSFSMTKWLAVIALGAFLCGGCEMFNKDKNKDKSTTQPMKMSASGSSAKCSACDAPSAKAK